MQFYYHHRLGGVPQAVYGDDAGELVRLPDDILDTVAFLAVAEAHDEADRRCRGTAFLMSVHSTMHNDITFPYLVTAKHCITKAIDENCSLYLRLNKTDDETEDIKLPLDRWHFSTDDPSVDLAVLPFCPDRKRYRYRTISYKM